MKTNVAQSDMWRKTIEYKQIRLVRIALPSDIFIHYAVQCQDILNKCLGDVNVTTNRCKLRTL